MFLYIHTFSAAIADEVTLFLSQEAEPIPEWSRVDGATRLLSNQMDSGREIPAAGAPFGSAPAAAAPVARFHEHSAVYSQSLPI